MLNFDLVGEHFEGGALHPLGQWSNRNEHAGSSEGDNIASHQHSLWAWTSASQRHTGPISFLKPDSFVPKPQTGGPGSRTE